MDKQLKATALIVIIAVAGVGLYLFLPKVSTEFHYERGWSGFDDFSISIWNTMDCNLTISCTEDDDLFCRVDVELYEAGFEGTDVQVYWEANSRILGINEWRPLRPVRVKSLDIVLGTAVPVSIDVYACYNLTAVVSYSNGALLGGSFEYFANGSISVNLDEDVDFSEMLFGGHTVSIGENPSLEAPSTIFLDIDLPERLAGFADFGKASVYFIERTGWVSLDPNFYGTSYTYPTRPAFGIHTLSGSVTARLVD